MHKFTDADTGQPVFVAQHQPFRICTNSFGHTVITQRVYGSSLSSIGGDRWFDYIVKEPILYVAQKFGVWPT